MRLCGGAGPPGSQWRSCSRRESQNDEASACKAEKEKEGEENHSDEGSLKVGG